MSFRLLVYHDIPERYRPFLEQNGIEVVRGSQPTEAGICGDIAGCDAIVAFEQPENGFNRAIIDAGNRLKLIARRGVGYESVDIAYAAEKGVYVTNTPGVNYTSVAEAAVLLMLECVRNTQKTAERFRAERDGYRFFNATPETRGMELKGKTLGLIGCGNVGRAVAHIASHGFLMNVIGYDPYSKGEIAGVTRCREPEEVFRNADIVSIHMPATPQTIRSIGMEQFRMMKPGAYFINTARGQIVVEKELIAALEQGIIRGAGLDVFEQEPIAEESFALFGLERVALSPHNSAFTVESYHNGLRSVFESVAEVARGQIPTCRVNDPDPALRLLKRWK